MKNYIKVVITFFCVVSASVFANDSMTTDEKELQKREMIMPMMPTAPSGFDWKVFYGIGVLCPSKWDFVYPQGETPATCTHQESGLNLKTEVFSVLDAGDKPPASALAAKLMKEITDQSRNSIERFDDMGSGKFVLRYKTKISGENLITHKYYVADDESKRLFVLSLSESAEKWDSAWEQGEVVFGKVAVLPMWNYL